MATEPTWEELLGSKNWDGLIDPLNLSLRDFVLHCGDLSQAPMDAFNDDKGSKYAGSSRYGKKSFFEKVMLESASDYEVRAFLYAPTKLVSPSTTFNNSKSDDSWDRESNMIGYIAVTTDEVSQASGRREIYIVWRGSVTFAEGMNDLDQGLVSAQELVPSEKDPKKVPRVMTGWLKMYVSSNPDSTFTNLSARTQLQKKIEELRNQYKDEKLSIIATGHSLGASLATLSAFDLVENRIRDIRVAAVVSASPHVGDQVFVDRVKMYPNLKVFRTLNTHDIVPLYPQTLSWEYRAVGVELKVDKHKSPYLKTYADEHNLQGLLHVVSGWNGDNKPFEWSGKRSLALANRDTDLLKDDYLIPVHWWVEHNRGMIRDKNGEWVLVQDEPEHEFQNVDGNQG
ncbi:phospholipase A1-IIdelta-like [Primulina tabacum]|uniref:phospholipase A1-IIdelta-like n=1 Tax=Primulina tabacum TaxID=48773 RepID=UPI003F59FB27